MSTVLPADHPLRGQLNDEVHARPPDALDAPARVSYLALLSDAAQRETAWHAVDALAVRFDAPRPATGASHHSAEFGPFRLQLRLQSTVEGLSVAAVTYYIVGLVGYAAKGVEEAGVHLDPAVVMGAAVPVVAGIMALALRRLRRHVHDADGP